ncbi:hypothetical protein ZIOFF_049179 [Zingiber officinale]|uniref:BRCA1/BRCA2-containing complex subunit 45 n=1 Tax=Zingiber officinale TaxID=94328 RepID=A0A8J5FWG7_ZINOF|nr:hypothetical protein ZIOFF_049179 [Zingiber officinale]
MDLSTAMWTASVVGAVTVYWFVWVMGSAEVKGKRAVNLKMGSIMQDKVQDKYKQYWSFFLCSKEGIAAAFDNDNAPAFVDTFYNLITDIYEWGWGQSFHLSRNVIYNALHPSLAPDVVFSLEDDDFDPLGDIAREGEMRLSKSSLCDWNGKDPSKLMALVHELRDLYTHYQRRRVGEIDDARLKFELNTMLSREKPIVDVRTGLPNAFLPVPDDYRMEKLVVDVRVGFPNAFL